ncbi:RNA methyltransferase [Mucilaginibacter sp. Bleaf8]|uniref:methyltransferase RsmF C-terminal domain-like protein n=1 Tax=Mucilaginibacter sp. Bleaf8 TaxID=2834430 RepID=UPI001BCBF08E|nr:RsmB/NOP family class I SAM-dependent RNA methyltransferase [Mucilaginibacter sp. Bleaf8]MBS7567109.1 RNA methyltransferase [Mucilaginibacter sp. Bleaf8]
MTQAAQFPEGFVSSLQNTPGFQQNTFIKVHADADAPTSVRTNPLKATEFPNSETVQWCADGYYLNNRPSFTFDPLFHAGCYYVQEASSMFIDHILHHIYNSDREPITALDLCAAPGGKSTLISSFLADEDLLVANEIIKTRVPVLADNLTRWGKSNTIVTNNDPKSFSKLKSFFDLIVVDAPCSGSGMFRKDPAAMEEWSEANVNLCQQRQERILADVYPALREDGYLIYSTCSYSYEEDEAVLDWLCKEFELESIRIPIDTSWGIVESQSADKQAWGYRFYPDQVKGEGLFVACLQKKENSGEVSVRKNKQSSKPNYKEMDLVKEYVINPSSLYFFKHNDDWLAINKAHRDNLEMLQQFLYIKKSGIRLGKLAGKELIPDHELALSIIVNKDKILQTELNYEQAIAYLRRDNINDLNTQEKGWSLMTYKGFALGWAKLLPNRINNYYPKELRILSQEIIKEQ